MTAIEKEAAQPRFKAKDVLPKEFEVLIPE
jgi:hypothetical protein